MSPTLVTCGKNGICYSGFVVSAFLMRKVFKRPDLLSGLCCFHDRRLLNRPPAMPKFHPRLPTCAVDKESAWAILKLSSPHILPMSSCLPERCPRMKKSLTYLGASLLICLAGLSAHATVTLPYADGFGYAEGSLNIVGGPNWVLGSGTSFEIAVSNAAALTRDFRRPPGKVCAARPAAVPNGRSCNSLPCRRWMAMPCLFPFY